MKKELSRTELKAAKNLLKKLIEKSEFNELDTLQAKVIVGLINVIEDYGKWNAADSTGISISNFSKYCNVENVIDVLRGMSHDYSDHKNGIDLHVEATYGLEQFFFSTKFAAAMAIELMKKVGNITMKLKETRLYNEGSSYYHATWSKLAQEIDAEAEAELTAQLNLQAANSVEEITAEDDGSNGDEITEEFKFEAGEYYTNEGSVGGTFYVEKITRCYVVGYLVNANIGDTDDNWLTESHKFKRQGCLVKADSSDYFCDAECIKTDPLYSNALLVRAYNKNTVIAEEKRANTRLINYIGIICETNIIADARKKIEYQNRNSAIRKARAAVTDIVLAYLNGNFAEQVESVDMPEVAEIVAEDDGSNDEPEEDILATLDTTVDTDCDTEDELIDEAEPVQEKIYEAHWTLGYDNPRSDSKEFKTAVDAYNFLKKKIRRYKNTTYWHHYITVGGWNGKWIYEEGECGEKTTDPEIQALMDAADYETEISLNAAENKHFLNFILANYNITLEELFDFLVFYYETTGNYFENAGGRTARAKLSEWIATQKASLEIADYAVTPEAQEVAVQAEIDNAKTEATRAPQLDLQAVNDYWDYDPAMEPVPEEEPMTFELGKIYRPELLKADDVLVPSLEYVKLLNICDGVATFLDNVENIIKGTVVTENGVEVVKGVEHSEHCFPLSYVGQIVISAAARLEDIWGIYSEGFDRAREWREQNATFPLYKYDASWGKAVFKGRVLNALLVKEPPTNDAPADDERDAKAAADTVTEFEVGKTYLYKDAFNGVTDYLTVTARFEDSTGYDFITVEDSKGKQYICKVIQYTVDGYTTYIKEYITCEIGTSKAEVNVDDTVTNAEIVTEFEVGKTYEYKDCFDELTDYLKVTARFKDGADVYITVKDSCGNFHTFKVLLSGTSYKITDNCRYTAEYITDGKHIYEAYSYDIKAKN